MSRNKRVRIRCCFRLERGRRAGQLCKELISPLDGEHKYCVTHSMLIGHRRAVAYFENNKDHA